eukprot:Clim_evm31s147 gene=Clim_evmTU31s147
MSLKIDWDKFDTEVAQQVERHLNEQLNNIIEKLQIQHGGSLPIGSISISDLAFGENAPDVEIRSIGDPYEIFFGADGSFGTGEFNSDPTATYTYLVQQSERERYYAGGRSRHRQTTDHGGLRSTPGTPSGFAGYAPSSSAASAASAFNRPPPSPAPATPSGAVQYATNVGTPTYHHSSPAPGGHSRYRRGEAPTGKANADRTSKPQSQPSGAARHGTGIVHRGALGVQQSTVATQSGSTQTTPRGAKLMPQDSLENVERWRQSSAAIFPVDQDALDDDTENDEDEEMRPLDVTSPPQQPRAKSERHPSRSTTDDWLGGSTTQEDEDELTVRAINSQEEHMYGRSSLSGASSTGAGGMSDGRRRRSMRHLRSSSVGVGPLLEAAVGETESSMAKEVKGSWERLAHSEINISDPHRQGRHDEGDGLDRKWKAPDILQVEVNISYRGDIRAGIDCDLTVNFPTPAFAYLPIHVDITAIELNAVLIVAFHLHEHKACITLMPCDEYDDRTSTTRQALHQEANLAPPRLDTGTNHYAFHRSSHSSERLHGQLKGRGRDNMISRSAMSLMDMNEHPLRQIQLRTKLGDPSKAPLSNVEKVESFLRQQIRKHLVQQLVFPKFRCLELDNLDL